MLGYFKKLLLLSSIQVLSLNFSQASLFEPPFTDIKSPVNKVDSIALIDPTSIMVIYNHNGTVRGGAYNISAFGGVYIASLHTITGSNFYLLHKDYYRFYGFKTTEKNVSIDAIVMIDRRLYPEGRLSSVLTEIFQALASRPIRPAATGYAINGIVTNGTNTEYLISTNKGQLLYNNQTQKTYMRIDSKKSTIKPGSSGTIVVAQPADFYSSPFDAELELQSNVAVGILKCRVVRGSPNKNEILYEVQTFEFLENPNYWMEELTEPPKMIFEKDCEQINGRGHGGA